ncbi:MAG: mannose-1-phosphate guanylyltransferase [Bacteroidales bacterium]|nr:mannose-1-phosphate guanylyltransferase [Bacteroidales bacterium]
MTNSKTYCIIMAGGTGTRLWPVSRDRYPKQFLKVEGAECSLIRDTWNRFAGLIPEENIVVITSDRYENLVMEHLPELRPENLIVEPYVRDTAPCIAYASMKILMRDPEAVTVVTPADHLIPDVDEFRANLGEAISYASENNVLMTLGLVPSYPDTNYGYIQVTGGTGACYLDGARKVKTFTEKPSVDMAKVFLGTGEFLWNAGIFVWKASVILDELEVLLPEVMGPFAGWKEHLDEPAFIQRAYSDCLRISIDYGVMEKTDKAWVYPAKFQWRDIGTWSTISEALGKGDGNSNVTISDTALLLQDTEGCTIIPSRSNKLIAVKGLDDYLIIDTEDVLLICPKKDNKFKEMLGGLAMPGYETYK